MTQKEKELFMVVRSIHYNNVVMKKLKEYTLPEWLVCLSEEVLLEYAIPIFSRVLHKYPMLCGMNKEWQVIYEITKVSEEFWEVNKEWKVYFYKIINTILSQYEEGKLIASIPEEYLYQFKNFMIPIRRPSRKDIQPEQR